MSSKIRVAISGGGVAGASMLHALLGYTHLDTHIFESAPAFRESGVAFGLARNATAALALIGPSAAACLERAGGVPMEGVRFLLGQGPDAGELVYEVDNKLAYIGYAFIRRVQQALRAEYGASTLTSPPQLEGKPTVTIVQRANLLREFLADVPQDRMHASKKLQSVERNESLILHFADGTTHECDILIGADGIHSTVRKFVLSDPAAAPRNSGSWAIMKLIPYEDARAIIGTAHLDAEDAREHAWITNHTFILHNILSSRSQVQYLVCGYDEDAAPQQWQRTFTKEQLEELYKGKGWLPHLEQAFAKVLCNEPEQQAFYIFEHPPVKTYVNGPLCVVGDAAHATTPYQGSGGGMCVEDALLLSRLLGRASSTDEAILALRVYDKGRLQRTQQIIESSWQTGRMFFGMHETTGLDASRLKTQMARRWDFIVDFDNEAAIVRAMQEFDAAVNSSNVGS